jgi:hypothetical protein
MGPFGRECRRFDPGSLGIFSVMLAQLAGPYFPSACTER